MKNKTSFFQIVKHNSALFGKAIGTGVTAVSAAIFRHNGLKRATAATIESSKKNMDGLTKQAENLRTDVKLSKKAKKKRREERAAEKAERRKERMKNRSDFPEDFPNQEELFDAGVNTLKKVLDHPDLTEIDGIGPKLSETIRKAAKRAQESSKQEERKAA